MEAIASTPHTPGPWEVESIPDARGLGRRVFTGRIEVKREDDLIACMHAKHFSGDGSADLANAQLIAAAPELLAQMRRFLPVLERLEAVPAMWKVMTAGLGIGTLNAYRAALAKASQH
jgi:hypothetical protein